MAFDWTYSDEQGRDIADIPPGVHQISVKRVMYTKRDGTPLVSKNNEPVITLVLEDAEGRQLLDRLTLSDKAAWRLKKWLSRLNVDAKALNAKGLLLADFLRPEIGKEFLYAKTCWVEVTQDGQYLRIDPLKEEDGKRRGKKVEAPPAADTDDLPF